MAGDIGYNGVYSSLVESTTAHLRQKWIDAIHKLKSLNPETVVVGHKLPGAVDGSWLLDATEDYIEMWGELVAEAKDAEDMFEKVRGKDPDKIGVFALWTSCLQQFPSNSSAKA